MVARTSLQNSLIAASLKCSPAYRKGSTTNFTLCKNNGNTPANGVGGMHLGWNVSVCCAQNNPGEKVKDKQIEQMNSRFSCPELIVT